ncbi:MAG: hypothetical protein IPK19_04020 [Chloroflexi bacterium]|nr:hypothetical protein [Chloroflexota bacterium]
MRKIILLLAALVGALVLTGPIAVLGQESGPLVSVILSSEGLSAPETLPKGLVTIQFENTAEAPFIGVLLRLNDGVTLDDFFAAIAEDPLGMLPLVSLRGGPGLMPGQAGSVTYDLDAGEYVLADFAGEEPQLAMFTVADGEDVTQVQPNADLHVVMVDFGYGLPLTVPAGERVWRIENAGQQWHELAILPVEPETTIEDVQALLAEGEESGLQQLPLLMPLSAGEVAWLAVNLEPGTYALICNLPDLMNMEDMHTHYELGMIQLITVEDV